jgi:predicted small metal-binding protein
MKISFKADNSQSEIKSGLNMVLFTCRDLGMDCSFETTGTTDKEIIKKFIDHAESTHNMPVLTADVIFKVKKAIKNRSKEGVKAGNASITSASSCFTITKFLPLP